MHKDQKRLQDVFLPQLVGRIASEDPVAERECTVLNRAFTQGPDPLFLMETCPVEFSALCRSLNISEESGREAIESAHWQGPGSLLEGAGLPDPLDSYEDMPEAWRLEALWLVLASMSDCIEEGYTDEITMVERLQRAMAAATTLSRFVHPDRSLFDVVCKAEASLKTFKTTTEFTPDPRFGKPMATADHGFYVGFKAGHKAVAVKSGSLTFYGTVPSTTLEEQGVTVDKVLSPHFGIIFA